MDCQSPKDCSGSSTSLELYDTIVESACDYVCVNVPRKEALMLENMVRASKKGPPVLQAPLSNETVEFSTKNEASLSNLETTICEAKTLLKKRTCGLSSVQECTEISCALGCRPWVCTLDCVCSERRFQMGCDGRRSRPARL